MSPRWPAAMAPTRSLLLLTGALSAFGVPWCAQADTVPPAVVRFGDHQGFSRIVFDTADAAALDDTLDGNSLSVAPAGAIHFDALARLRNVRTIRTSGGAITFELAAGTSVRRSIINSHLVFDILDPASASAAAEPNAATKPDVTSRRPHALLARVPAQARRGWLASRPEHHDDVPDASAVHASQPVPLRAVDVAKNPAADTPSKPISRDPSETVPHGLAATTADVPQAGPGHLLSLPFGPQVGAAAFRQGEDAVVVFDERKPIDMASVRADPVFGQSTVQLMPTATILRVRLAKPAELRLNRDGGHWTITAIGGDAVPTVLQPILPTQMADRLELPARSAGLVVSMPDVDTGGILIVGTQRDPGQAMATARQTPDFALLPTWQGVVVEAISDAVVLHADTQGFELRSDAEGRALSSSSGQTQVAAAAAASRMSRAFDLPAFSTPALLRRLQGALVSASTTPIQSRAEARRHVAEAMIALGMGAEAQAVLGLAAEADARSLDDPTASGLAVVAAVLAGRNGSDMHGLDDPRLAGTDEAALWHAVADATAHERSPAAAQTFAALLPLVLDYPEPLRRRLLPLVAETMAWGGQSDAAQHLVDVHKDNADLDLARADLLDAEVRRNSHDPAAALALYDRLAREPDRLVGFRAAVNAAELRLASGLATPAQTASALDKMLYAWRGDDREVDLRLRVAHLLAQSGQWRPALQMLRETESQWPDRKEPIRAQLMATLTQAVSSEATPSTKPLDLVAMVEENADLLPDGEPGQRLVERVCDQLLALDLPNRAIPFLEKMVTASKPGVARAAFGGKLASARLEQGNPDGAIAALAATANETLPADLLESRTISFATAAAKLGDLPSAKRALTELNTQAGDQALADLAEAAKNWPEEVAALRQLMARAMPDAGRLDAAQARIVLRLASAASQIADAATLSWIRAQALARMPPGKEAELCDLLTADPVRSVSDLSRVTREVALARATQGGLPALASR